MKKIKKSYVFMIVCCLVFLILGFLGGLFIGKGLVKEKTCPENPNIKEPIIKEYTTFNKQKIYLYNLNELKLKNDDTEITLKEYLNQYQDFAEAFATFEKELDLQKTLRDGGTMIYTVKSNSKLFSSKDLTVVKCNTTDGNTDVYFGLNFDNVVAFDHGVCGKNFFTDAKFTRVYTIKKINILDTYEDNGTKKYSLELMISDDEGKSTKITRVMSDEDKEILKEKTKYTFYFENKYKEHIKEDIAYIFANCTLTGVVPYGK